MNGLAGILTALRKEQRLSQQTVATKLGISQQAYGHYETGKREPTIDNLIVLADLFKVPIDLLVGRYYMPQMLQSMESPKVVRSKKIINGKEMTVVSFRDKNYQESDDE